MSTAGKAVFLSALTVVMALAAVFLVPVMVFRSMALGMILSVVAVAARVTHAAPRVLVALGDRVLVRKNTDDPDITAESRWQRWTGVALRRPGRVLAIGLVVLGALIVPALGMHLGMPGAARRRHGPHQPRRLRPARRRLRARRGGPAFITTPAADASAVARVASAVPGVVDAPRRDRARADRPGRRARDRIHPGRRLAHGDAGRRPCVRGSRTAAPDARVGGPAAQNRDLTAVLTGRAPYAIGLILIVAFVLLLVVFRSLVVALTSILMNLLTVGAAFGFATTRVPTRPRHGPARHPAPGVRRRLGAAVLLRPALRPVDGLPAVPARRDPRTLRGDRRHPARDRAKASPAPAGPSPTPRSS